MWVTFEFFFREGKWKLMFVGGYKASTLANIQHKSMYIIYPM